MVYRCLITLFSTWSDFNWQPETDFFFASNRWIQSLTTKRRDDFSRAADRRESTKLNGELLNAPCPLSSLPRRGRGKGEGAIEKGSGFTFLLRKALSEEGGVFLVFGLLLLSGCRQ